MKKSKQQIEDEQAAMVLDAKGCNLLARHIVGKAVTDWIRLSTGKDLPKPDQNFSELKRFFRSPFFEAIFPNLSGEEAIAKLEAKYPSKYPK